jgi:DNA-binding response OmpR family regulator
MKKKILIIEDDISLREAIDATLTKLDYELFNVENGQNIISVINSFNPDLILLDLVLPGKDGFEILEEIKIKNSIPTPVIVLTNLNSGDDKKRCTDLGVADYILKTDISLRQIGENISALLSA